MMYHVLRTSRCEGTVRTPCPDLPAAIATLSRQAEEGERLRQQGGHQRYFCLANATAVPVGEAALPAPDTLVIYVEGGTVQWVGSDNAHVRIFIVDADMDADDPPVACWEEGPRPLSELEEAIREQVFGPTPAVPALPSPPSRPALAWADILPAEVARNEKEPAPPQTVPKPPPTDESSAPDAAATPPAAPDRDAFGWNLTLKDRQRLLQATPPATSHRRGSTTIQEHTCSLVLPDGRACAVDYTRYNLHYHQFAYAAPLCQKLYCSTPLENSLIAIEREAQARAIEAFQKAQQEEQAEMRRKTAPPGWKATSASGETALRAKSAQEYAGLYAVCLRYASGQMTPVGAAYEMPEQAQQEIESGLHRQRQLHNGQALVVGICNRWGRRWQEPRFLATGAAHPAPPESEPQKPVQPFPPSLP